MSLSPPEKVGKLQQTLHEKTHVLILSESRMREIRTSGSTSRGVQTELRNGLRHRHKAKAAGNSYSPSLTPPRHPLTLPALACLAVASARRQVAVLVRRFLFINLLIELKTTRSRVAHRVFRSPHRRPRRVGDPGRKAHKSVRARGLVAVLSTKRAGVRLPAAQRVRPSMELGTGAEPAYRGRL